MRHAHCFEKSDNVKKKKKKQQELSTHSIHYTYIQCIYRNGWFERKKKFWLLVATAIKTKLSSRRHKVIANCFDFSVTVAVAEIVNEMRGAMKKREDDGGDDDDNVEKSTVIDKAATC